MLKNLTAYAYNKIINFIAPPHCASCKNFLIKNDVFCLKCYHNIRPIVSTALHITKAKSIQVFAASDYQDPIKQLILAKGWSNIVASTQLARLILSLTNVKHIACDVLVPIPLHWTRFAWRGYNQAAEIAQIIGKQKSSPVELLLKRKKRTAHQAQLTHDKRAENVKNVFILNASDKSFYEGKHIVLVDDLMTTGATLRAAAKELYKLKPASITAVVACRVV